MCGIFRRKRWVSDGKPRRRLREFVPQELPGVVRSDNILLPGSVAPRHVSWIKAARKEFERFPPGAQLQFRTALDVAARGEKSATAKPMKGLGSGMLEIALSFHGNAFRLVYALQLADEIWVVHAFQKKSTQGIKTPRHEIDLILARIKRLHEELS